MASKREVYVGIGAVLMLFAVLTDRMLSLDIGGMGALGGMDTRVGFRSVTVCILGQCESASRGSSLGTIAFIVGLAAVVALVAAIVMDRRNDDDRYYRPAGSVALVWLLTVVIWYFDMPGREVLSFGMGLWASILGVGLASSACLRPGGSDFDGFARVQMRQAELDAKLQAFANGSGAESSEEVASSESAAEAEQSNGPASRTELPKANLRFMATSVRISDDGLDATYADGSTRRVRFSDVGQIVARGLPFELGYGDALLFDVVTRDDPREPIRILPDTSVNYQYLPSGRSDDSDDNARRLIRLIRALNPELKMDEGSTRFVDGGEAALPFQTVEHFWQYDSRYPR